MSAVLTVDIPPLHGINGLQLQATRWPLRRPPHSTIRDRPLPRIAVCAHAATQAADRATATAADKHAFASSIPSQLLAVEVLRRTLQSTQYVSIHYTERLAEAGIEPSVGSVGDSYDNALAETIIGLFKTEIIRPRGPWRNLDQVEYATLEWVDWFNNRRLLGPIGDIPPVELEQLHYHEQEVWPMMAGPTNRASGIPGVIQLDCFCGGP